MNRRRFLYRGCLSGLSWTALGFGLGSPVRLLGADIVENDKSNPNWADPTFKATAASSSTVGDPPWGYQPSNVFGDNLFLGWEADQQTSGAWLEIQFPEPKPIQEIWILPEPLPRGVPGQEPYMLTYSRVKLYEAPRRITCSFTNGISFKVELRKADYFQIVTLPKPVTAASIRISVDEVWPKEGGKETGISKVRLFPRRHDPSLEIDVYRMYDVKNGQLVQAATLHLTNPANEIGNGHLTVSHEGKTLMHSRLQPIKGQAATDQEIWIPSPISDTTMDFELSTAGSTLCKRQLHVPAYRSYFDRGTFSLDCTCHNDLGWLNTQEKTADYRSEQTILPALQLLKEYPEFRYSMECTAYLREFLSRHPEKRDEMAEAMRARRFTWGASYVECQEVHVGPEKLVRQFYLGRAWLKKTFPGVDTHFYVKTDPPSMTLQMPQILAKAGVRYIIQGRMPFGFYNWEAPDGSMALVYAYHYPLTLLDPKDNRGWLRFAEQREYYYAPRHLPPMLIYDYTGDYLPPQPDLPPYVRAQNAAMQRFSEAWNSRFASDPSRQIHPPRMDFVEPEGFLDKFTEHPLDITTLRGDWPFSWAYYDEPSNREGLLDGRHAHNRLLAAERLYTALGLSSGFDQYPAADFADAWQANCWPDHGWGGNQGLLTDKNYNDSYAKSKHMADQILSGVGAELISRIARSSASQKPVVVYNSLSWQRNDIVECKFKPAAGGEGFKLRDETGKEIPCEILVDRSAAGYTKFVFLAEAVPAVGYRTFFLEPSSSPPPAKTPLAGDSAETDLYRAQFGKGGLKSLYAKRQKWEVFRTDKFDGGEVLQFTAPGIAWEDPEIVTMADFDKTSHHPFRFTKFEKGPVRITAVREARFNHFMLRQMFLLYPDLDRVDFEIELLRWDGQKDRELRVAFPINLDDARLSYEVPFGTVEIGKDEMDFSLLPPDTDTVFRPQIYGGDHPLAYREAINWIDASSRNYLSSGCLAASDSTVHLFRDQTSDPVSYPVLQHVLLSTRKSLAWNPEYWCTQAGNHRYRMAIFPHGGDWRERYRDAIALNYPLIAFVGSEHPQPVGKALPALNSFLSIEPSNLVLTAMKKAENDNRIATRFYEAEGQDCLARIRLPNVIKKANRCSLIEEDQEELPIMGDGSLSIAIRPWEIVTLKIAL